jgi:hypothetical protein
MRAERIGPSADGLRGERDPPVHRRPKHQAMLNTPDLARIMRGVWTLPRACNNYEYNARMAIILIDVTTRS